MSPSPSRRYISAAPPAQPVAAAADTTAASARVTAAESVQVPSQPAAHDIILQASFHVGACAFDRGAGRADRARR